MNTVAMKPPPVQTRDVIDRHAQHHGAKRIPVYRQQPKLCKSAAQLGLNCCLRRFKDRDEFDDFFAGDAFDIGA